MASTYFSGLSFARAKKNKEDLEKTNPQEPVLKDEDERFLERHMSVDQSAGNSREVGAAKITEDGQEKEATTEELEQTNSSADQAVIPEVKPESGDGAQEGEEVTEEKSYDDEVKAKAAERVKARKEKKSSKGFDLPSQEEAEASTRGFNEKSAREAESTPSSGSRSWLSYIPAIPAPKNTNPSQQAWTASVKESVAQGQGSQRNWSQYVPSMPSIPTSWRPSSRDKDSAPEAVYNEDGTINEEATKERQEKEVSVLLDNLNLSSINNRVFAFSADTQTYYERFAQVLKDSINGAPTAYDDMDKLMREAGPKLEQQFQSMPPFVQTLVKSLPARLGSTLGPEMLAAASEKPGADMKSRMEAASAPGAASDTSGGVNLNASSSSETAEKDSEEQGKKKRRIPGLKSLVSSEGAVASMLRNVVTFLQTRFPLLASTTNVVMSLAVFSKFPPVTFSTARALLMVLPLFFETCIGGELMRWQF